MIFWYCWSVRKGAQALAVQNVLRNFQFPACIKCFISLCYFLSFYLQSSSSFMNNFPPIKQARSRTCTESEFNPPQWWKTSSSTLSLEFFCVAFYSVFKCCPMILNYDSPDNFNQVTSSGYCTLLEVLFRPFVSRIDYVMKREKDNNHLVLCSNHL